MARRLFKKILARPRNFREKNFEIRLRNLKIKLKNRETEAKKEKDTEENNAKK